LFYEEAYTNAPGDVVARRHSTNVTVRVEAYGGKYGGLLSLTQAGFDKLSFVSGDVIPQGSVMIGERERRIWEAEYAPFVHSDEKDDVVVETRFSEHIIGEESYDDEKLTVVKLTSVTDAVNPENRYRHRLGVGESVRVYKTPNISIDSVQTKYGIAIDGNYSINYRAPLEGLRDYLLFSDGGSCYEVYFYIVQPSGYQISSIETNVYAAVGCSGGFEMHFRGYLLPRDVSFEHLQVVEIPCESTDAVGYYQQTSKTNLWDHGAHGAGVWVSVGECNSISDETVMEVNDPPWFDGGSFSWPIPNAWRMCDDFGRTNVFCSTDQHFVLDAEGTARMSKFGYVGTRLTNGVFTVTQDDLRGK
jgi:hypothetical protein